jgi:hypothetical protein
VFVEETGYGSQASHSYYHKVGDEVSALEWPEECGLVLVTVSRERKLVKTEKWSLLSQVPNA